MGKVMFNALTLLSETLTLKESRVSLLYLRAFCKLQSHELNIYVLRTINPLEGSSGHLWSNLLLKAGASMGSDQAPQVFIQFDIENHQ